MTAFWSCILVSFGGFLLSSVGGLGSELLDSFAGRSLEAYCRLKRRRERFGSVLDHQDAAIHGSDLSCVDFHPSLLPLFVLFFIPWRNFVVSR